MRAIFSVTFLTICSPAFSQGGLDLEFDQAGLLPSSSVDVDFYTTGLSESQAFQAPGGALVQTTGCGVGNHSYLTGHHFGPQTFRYRPQYNMWIEARARLLSSCGWAGAYIAAYDETNRLSGVLLPAGLEVQITGSSVLFPVTNMSAWHTYRLESAANSNSIDVYIDGALVGAGLSWTSFVPGGFGFGDGISASGNGAHVEWDYVRSRNTLGVTYCSPAVPNSTGYPAVVVASGSPSVTSNSFGLTAISMPPNQFTYFVVGDTTANIPMAGGSSGTLCITGAVGRFASQAQSTGPLGQASIQINLASLPTNPAQAVLPGQTWHFQAWYRDSNPGPTSNFTDAVQVLFQ